LWAISAQNYWDFVHDVAEAIASWSRC